MKRATWGALCVVKKAKGVSDAESQAAIRKHGGNPKSSIAQLGMHVVEVPAGAAAAIMKQMQGDPAKRVSPKKTLFSASAIDFHLARHN